jgi:hypothetical protein
MPLMSSKLTPEWPREGIGAHLIREPPRPEATATREPASTRMEAEVGAATSVESQDCMGARLNEDVEPGGRHGPGATWYYKSLPQRGGGTLESMCEG